MLMRERAQRTIKLNRQLAWSMAFVAGAVNAGGFLAVARYTSHMTGVVSAMADELALGHFGLSLEAVSMLIAFVGGAFFSTSLINLWKRRRMRSSYAISLVVEAMLLLMFGLLGSRLAELDELFMPATVLLLCFIMGMHNSIVTKISGADVRTTHITGIATDVGIELSKLFYYNRSSHERLGRVEANRNKLKLHSIILCSFFSGGVSGALAYKHWGYQATVPLAIFLCLIAVNPIAYDIRVRLRWMRLR